MMMIPRRRDFDLFDTMFGDDPFFMGGEPNKIMKTDIKEKKDKYVIAIDLPGYEKEDIKVSIQDGYLNVHAKTSKNNDEKEDDGNFVRRERFFGECSRSFYVGDDVKEEEIKASFKNGTLSLEIPKKEEDKKIPDKKYIEIEG